MKYFTYDWFRDIWLPAAGAILIPVAIAFFTWWFGASRAEKQKELRDLRDNLNLLTSISMATLNSINFLYDRVAKIQLNIKKTTKNLKKLSQNSEIPDVDKICYGFVFDNMYKDIPLNQYTSCLVYHKNFIYNLSIIKSLITLTETYICKRNKIIEDIANIIDLSVMNSRYRNFILNEEKEIDKFLYDICRIALLLQIVITDIQVIGKKNRKLKLVDAYISPNQSEFLNIASKTVSNKDKIFNNDG